MSVFLINNYFVKLVIWTTVMSDNEWIKLLLPYKFTYFDVQEMCAIYTVTDLFLCKPT